MNENQKQKSDKKIKVAFYSSLISLFLTLGKFVVGVLTGSLGILAEAIHSLIDFLATLITFYAVKFSSQPADDDHHYGHEKIESLSALIETGLLFATSFWILYEALYRIFFEADVKVEVTWYAIAIILLSIFLDFNRSRALLKVYKETGSQALLADAAHFSSDMYTSFAVLVGLAFVYFKVPFADSVAAILVSVLVFKVGIDLMKKSLAILLDEAPEGVKDDILEMIKSVEGIKEAKGINVRSLDGTKIFTDINIVLNKDLKLEKAGEIKENLKNKILEKYNDSFVVVHVDHV